MCCILLSTAHIQTSHHIILLYPLSLFRSYARATRRRSSSRGAWSKARQLTSQKRFQRSAMDQSR